MKKILLTLTLSLPLALGAETFNYGFCPVDATEEQMSAQGSGKNNDIEVLLRLSPAEMPQVAALKGSKITGIRAKLRNDIERKSAIVARIGSLDSEVIKKDCWLNAGWNTVSFPEPIEIGDEEIYIGYRVNENQGSGSHPILASVNPAPSATSFINIGLTGWQDMGSKGSVMLQAIIDGDLTALEAPAATAAVYGFPKLIAPNAPFDATLSIKNLSSTPISSLTVDYIHGAVDLQAEIGPFETASIPVTLMSAAEESTDYPFVSTVSTVNGVSTPGAYASTAHLYITRDVFTRIPLIEEWTGLTCVNCPFMIYYLDRAREEYNKPHTYVAHHAGFDYDKLTQQVDKDLLFLFGEPRNQRNPAIMYDRSYLPGETELIFGANEASTAPYLSKLLAAENVPALAEVKVDIDGQTVTVHGKVSTGSKTADGKVRLSAYLIEDNIAPLPDYPQLGINAQVADGAPDDMVETFRHNGVIRANLTENSTGDKLEFDAEGNYSATFALPEFNEKWNRDNCHVVAFIHRYDESQLTDNFVLNSGDSRPFTPSESGIDEIISASGTDLRVVRALDGSIVVLTPVSSVKVYNAAGLPVDPNKPQPAGLYIVRATLPDGTKATAKIK